jgi:succinate dehydrogenase / fumarate reductase iron-sulfur subunit
LEACPQYSKIELQQREDESEVEFQQRETLAFDRAFIGAAAMNQVVLLHSHPVGAMTDRTRMQALVAEGNIQNCGKAANCQVVCPKHIPLMTSWARAGRAATLYAVKKFFDG